MRNNILIKQNIFKYISNIEIIFKVAYFLVDSSPIIAHFLLLFIDIFEIKNARGLIFNSFFVLFFF